MHFGFPHLTRGGFPGRTLIDFSPNFCNALSNEGFSNTASNFLYKFQFSNFIETWIREPSTTYI